jgi:hypothetical protein
VEWLCAARGGTAREGFSTRNFHRWSGATYHRKPKGSVHKKIRVLR